MRVTFDSNVWQFVVQPDLAQKNKSHDDFVIVHEALRSRRIEGFISETVGTLEGIRCVGRVSYFSSIKPIVDVKTERSGTNILASVQIGPDHGQHPGLAPVLQERLNAAFSLGISLMRAARIGMPVPAPFLNLEHYADEHDVASSAKRDERTGEVIEAIELRGVGAAAARNTIKQLYSGTGRKKFLGQSDTFSIAEQNQFSRDIAEWADGDSIAAHIAYVNDVFCSEDRGKSAGGSSILDERNRLWLQSTYGVKFATIQELALQLSERMVVLPVQTKPF